MAASAPLRAITYLAPGIPLGFFEHVSEYLGRELQREVILESEERISGPMHGDHDPFAAGRADLGFVCSPSYLYLVARPRPSVALVPVGFVFRDPRNRGEPHYFSDVIVRADRPASTLEDLRGAVFGFNDRCSLSGYYSLRQELAQRGYDDGFFREERCTGSHHASIEAVMNGAVDVAAIDSNVLLLELRRRADLSDDLSILESWGPYPIQPTIVSTRLSTEDRQRLTRALLRLTSDPGAEGPLGWIGLERCVAIEASLYDAERGALEALGQLPVPPR